MITIETDLTIEEITALDPQAWATPRCDQEWVLPEQPTPVGGLLVWKWWVNRVLTVNQVEIRYAGKTQLFATSYIVHLKRHDTLTIKASLHQIA